MLRRDFLRGAGAMSAGVLSASAAGGGLVQASGAKANDVRSIGVAAVSAADDLSIDNSVSQPARASATADAPGSAMSGAEARALWLATLTKLAEPVLTNLANGTLKANMPVEAVPSAAQDRRRFSHLEAFGRLLSGIAPWLELEAPAAAAAAAARASHVAGTSGADGRSGAAAALHAARTPDAWGAPSAAGTPGAADRSGATRTSSSAGASSAVGTSGEDGRSGAAGTQGAAYTSNAAGTSDAASDAAAAEARLRARFIDLTHRALANATDPQSPDHLNFTDGGQALVDTAFLAQAILRAPRVLWEWLDAPLRARVVASLESTRALQPGFNNWLLFSATVEAALKRCGARWDRMRVDYAIRQHEQWYKGDGLYGDGPDFHWDYYNSFVIHPMLLDVLTACAPENAAWTKLQPVMQTRAQRYAAIQERLIAQDGTFPAIGRSLAYRCGAFHALAQSALNGRLPEGLPTGQARRALTRVIRRTLEAPGTFDTNGWLQIGLCGHQPEVGETYISTGSLYLCSVALLPLGLLPSAPYWTEPEQPTTSERAWSGQPFPIDHALQA